MQSQGGFPTSLKHGDVVTLVHKSALGYQRSCWLQQVDGRVFRDQLKTRSPELISRPSMRHCRFLASCTVGNPTPNRGVPCQPRLVTGSAWRRRRAGQREQEKAKRPGRNPSAACRHQALRRSQPRGGRCKGAAKAGHLAPAASMRCRFLNQKTEVEASLCGLRDWSRRLCL